MKIASIVLGILALGTLISGNFFGFIIFGLIAFFLFRRANSDQQPKNPQKTNNSDRPGIITVNQKTPQGYTERVTYGVSVAGVTRRPDTVKGFIEGSARKVRLEPEPDNEYDPNAIQVIGIWMILFY